MRSFAGLVGRGPALSIQAPTARICDFHLDQVRDHLNQVHEEIRNPIVIVRRDQRVGHEDHDR